LSKTRFFVDLIAGEPGDSMPVLFSPRPAAFPEPEERFPVSGWTFGR
jgi:hypothetical protein